MTGLDDTEAATFGRRARDLVAAVTEAAAAPATYLIVFGENHPHFHALITARAAGVPAGRRSGDLFTLRTEAADPAAATLVPTVREAYARLTASGATAGA
ncbi:hypothetical protein [Streptomyces sp. CS227]|uniref:hypothetical protein n=1 Tax=Streptomyces sp. CS227 TaxID=1982763 RepID=UPI001C52C9FE|nr:hypothetical protein [Streptomyces sp. CS227]